MRAGHNILGPPCSAKQSQPKSHFTGGETDLEDRGDPGHRGRPRPPAGCLEAVWAQRAWGSGAPQGRTEQLPERRLHQGPPTRLGHPSRPHLTVLGLWPPALCKDRQGLVCSEPYVALQGWGHNGTRGRMLNEHCPRTLAELSEKAWPGAGKNALPVMLPTPPDYPCSARVPGLHLPST